jgi:protein-tyrosine phosphatase
MKEKELSAYDAPGLIQAYQDRGMIVHHLSYSSDKAAENILARLKEAETKEERVAAHCTHGIGLSGRIAAKWLVKRHGLTVDEAVEEALDTARKHGVERMGAPRQLKEWLGIQ